MHIVIQIGYTCKRDGVFLLKDKSKFAYCVSLGKIYIQSNLYDLCMLKRVEKEKHWAYTRKDQYIIFFT